MQRIPYILLMPLLLWGAGLSSLQAELKPLLDAELDAVSGQALADIVELLDPDQGSAGYRFMRVRTGATMEINANIDRLMLGQYYRNDPYVAQYCNNSSNTGECPLIGGGANDRTVNFGDFVNHPAANGSTAGGRNTTSGSFRSGFGPHADDRVTGSGGNYYVDVPTADVLIENLSLGAVVGGQLQPMVMENPFLEFVFDDSNGSLVGVRMGAESQSGHLGNASSNGSCNFVDIRCGGVLSFSGNLNLDVSLANSIMFEVARANFSPTVGFGAFLAGSSPAQTLGDLLHKDTREFYLSLQTTPIEYPTISGDSGRQLVPNLNNTPTLPRAVPGFALNISDGISAAPFDALDGIDKVTNCFNGNLGAC